MTAPKANVTDEDLNHEWIHVMQMRELLYVFFYILYAIEYLIRLVMLRNTHEAYRNISFEREAYANEGNSSYLKMRKFWAVWKYLF
ncbi:hypothetical protein [Proteiniphilum sp.]|uniref:hypothetical protein n=1 Tax=Proteiniphilum sp. TaxID=1926877 RepID=UPI002B205F70|nr:hypothetical protein [Proteiniphilum sp.]MEA4916302.1 hypothetical protein [Proteiniphilum sp.]